MIHLAVLVSFCASVCAALVAYDQSTYAWLAFLCLLILALFRIMFHLKRPFLASFGCLIIFLSVFNVVADRAAVHTSQYQKAFIHQHKHPVDAIGIIDEFPGYRFANNQYVIRLKDSDTRILVSSQPWQKFSYLDEIAVSGKLEDVREQDQEWHGYYRKLGVQYSMFNPTLSLAQSSHELTFNQRVVRVLFNVKIWVREKSMERFSSYASALFLGMLLGEKEELSKEEKDMFNYVGLSHILVVSGYNISLLITFIFIILKFTPKYLRVTLALLLILLFVLLVGADGSVVRAALMGSIIVFAKLARRQSAAVNVLFLVATLMLMFNPFSIFDAGFHLSFIATFALLIMPDIKRIPEFVMTTVWVFCFVGPYIAYLSDFVSLGGIVSNVLVAFLLPVFMTISLVSVGSFLIHVNLWIDGLTLDLMSRYVFVIAETAHLIPRIELSMPPLVTVACYAILISSILFFKNRYSTRQFIELRYQRPSQ